MRIHQWLPACHLAIDGILLLTQIWLTYEVLLQMKHPRPLWVQAGRIPEPPQSSGEGAPRFDGRELYVPPPLRAIIMGTPPASAVASLMFPRWLLSTPFDFGWAVVDLVIAALFWYGVGRLAERRSGRFRRLCAGYLILRAISIPLSMSYWVSGAGSLAVLLLGSCWIAVGLIAVGPGFRGLRRYWARDPGAYR